MIYHTECKLDFRKVIHPPRRRNNWGARVNTDSETTAKVGKGTRTSVTEDQVRAAYAKLISEKQPVSHRSIRAVLGHGSFSTIGRLLLEIKA